MSIIYVYSRICFMWCLICVCMNTIIWWWLCDMIMFNNVYVAWWNMIWFNDVNVYCERWCYDLWNLVIMIYENWMVLLAWLGIMNWQMGKLEVEELYYDIRTNTDQKGHMIMLMLCPKHLLANELWSRKYSLLKPFLRTPVKLLSFQSF